MTSDDRVVPLRQSEAIAISRLLWDIGSAETTSHQHEVDCFHWGAVLDHHAGLPPWPTEGQATEQVIAFYEGVAVRVSERIEQLRAGRDRTASDDTS